MIDSLVSVDQPRSADAGSGSACGGGRREGEGINRRAQPCYVAAAMRVSLEVNGAAHELDVREDRMLADVLRDELGLTGTKVACGEGTCGACTVLVDGRAVLGCLTLAAASAGA